MQGAWLYFHGQSRAVHKDRILKALTELGVRVSSQNPHDSKEPGVIFFDEVTPELRELLRTATFGSRKRILAVITGSQKNQLDSWQLLEAGASDVLGWSNLAGTSQAIAARLERWQSIDSMIQSEAVRDTMIGTSPALAPTLERIVEVGGLTDSSVLILGESGTGKEVAAHLIHQLDRRPSQGRFVIVDCSTISQHLAESEFFGHEKGAFTNAHASRDGAFALADGGTLFLDEVGELPPPLQAQLLRVIQERVYKRVGGNTWYRTDFRLICATNKDLADAVRKGEFRHDLYHRIATWTVKLPPLRDRPEDIIPLACHFMRQARPDADIPDLDDNVRSFLQCRPYPGNVRELKHVVFRMMDLYSGHGPLTVGQIPEEDHQALGSEPADWRDEQFIRAIRRAISLTKGLKDIGREAEETAIRIIVDEESGNLQRAARRLGITDRALQLRRASSRRISESGEAAAVSLAGLGD